MARRAQPDDVDRPGDWAAWQMFFEAHAAVCARLDADMQQRHGLSLRWYDVLLHLHAAPRRRLTMRDLGRAVVISKSGLTGLVDRMQRAGLVDRRPDPDDRRVIHVALTRTGADAYLRARADHRRGVREHFLRHLTPAEAGTLERSLGRIRARSRAAPAAR